MLTIKNLSKTYNPGSVNQRLALDNVSLHLDKGEFVTIIGGNGAGKSTLFGAISGSFYPDRGRVLLEERDITFVQEHKRSVDIGRLFQDPLRGTAPSMTIEENLALAYLRSSRQTMRLAIGHKERAYFKERLALLEMGLENRLKDKVGLLSGGQRQALTLLMATLTTPKLLLLDEHTAALDPATAEKVQKLTRRIVGQEGITCLMITHNISSALEMGGRTIMMDRGRIVLDLSGQKRKEMTVPGLLTLFKQQSNRDLDNDRMLLG